MARIGRPSKLTPERMLVLLFARRAGNTTRTCSRLAGIDKATLQRWLEKGGQEGSDAAYRDFRAAWLEASAEGEAELVAIVRRAALGYEEVTEHDVAKEALDRFGQVHELVEHHVTRTTRFSPRMALELLRRRNPAEWEKRLAVEHEGKVQHDHRVFLVETPDQAPPLPEGVLEIERLEEAAEKARQIEAENVRTRGANGGSNGAPREEGGKDS